MVEANPGFQNPEGHYNYDLFIILLLKGLNGETDSYKQHLERNGILSKALLVENDSLTRYSVNMAIAEVERLIMT